MSLKSAGCDQSPVWKSRSTGSGGGKASRKEKCVCFLFLSLLYVRVPLCPLTPASNCFKVSLRFSLWLSNLTWLSNLPVEISTSPVLCPLLSQGLSSVHCSLRACLSCHHLSFGLHWVSPCPAGWSNTVRPSPLGPFPELLQSFCKGPFVFTASKACTNPHFTPINQHSIFLTFPHWDCHDAPHWLLGLPQPSGRHTEAAQLLVCQCR